MWRRRASEVSKRRRGARVCESIIAIEAGWTRRNGIVRSTIWLVLWKSKNASHRRPCCGPSKFWFMVVSQPCQAAEMALVKLAWWECVYRGDVAFIHHCGGTGCLGWSWPLHYSYPPQRGNTGRPVTGIGLCPRWWWQHYGYLCCCPCMSLRY